MKHLLSVVALFVLIAAPAHAGLPEYRFAIRSVDELDAEMPRLAGEVLDDHASSGLSADPGNLFRLQLLAGRYQATIDTIRELRQSQHPDDPHAAATVYLQYEIYARANERQATDESDFEAAFAAAFREAFARLDNAQARRMTDRLVYNLDIARNQLVSTLEEFGERKTISRNEALELVRLYQPFHVYSRILPLVPDLLAEDEGKRYDIRDDVLIRTEDGATLSATVVRPRRFDSPQPAAFVFNIYSEPEADLWLAKLAAAHGYIGVVADARGKRLSPDEIEPYEHETSDTHAVLDWIVKQPWSNGEVGMFGGSYSGFAAWTAMKKPHPALKTIAPAAAAIPGLGLPMHNNVFLNANYCWAFHVTNNKTVDHQVCRDRERWESMEREWYTSGRAYRDIDSIDGTPNPLLQRWLDHPAYDEYWQQMVPYGDEFANIDIPVLTLTGYFDDGQVSALHYLNQHYAHHPDAEHYLVIGPYDHRGAQWGPSPVVNGYEIDPVARIRPTDIIFQWFDHILRDGPKPELLRDRINFQIMGTNTWRHAASITDTGNDVLRLYLDSKTVDDRYQLSTARPATANAVSQIVDLSDRSDTSYGYYPNPVILDELDAGDALVFASQPFEKAVEVSGAFTGTLKVTLNKHDMDVTVVLYEQMPDGRYFYLSHYLGRASYAPDMTERRLLEPGEVETIPIKRTYMTARRLEKGSRLVVIVDVNKGPWTQINYGTGRDVSDETIDDAGEPLTVEWRNDSFIELAIRR